MQSFLLFSFGKAKSNPRKAKQEEDVAALENFLVSNFSSEFANCFDIQENRLAIHSVNLQLDNGFAISFQMKNIKGMESGNAHRSQIVTLIH